jgi:hypothetical protein
MHERIIIKKKNKKVWEKPNISFLDIKKTKTGYTPGTPEDMGYDAVISP